MRLIEENNDQHERIDLLNISKVNVLLIFKLVYNFEIQILSNLFLEQLIKFFYIFLI
jgi:hypothetical protein